MADEKKKYWIKIEKDFLKSSQIKVIKSMPNGKDYIIFYLAIMLESTETVGHLRLNELVPYNEEMLAAITDTNIDIVRSAIKVFTSLGLLQILENGTIFLPDVPKRLGKEGESAERVRLHRERKELGLLHGNTEVTKCNDNKEKEKQEDKYKNEDINKNIQFVFEHWNSKKIINHVKLTIDIKKAIDKSLKEYSLEQIIEYIDRYHIAFNDISYYFDYKWTLIEFLTQKNAMRDFTDEGSKWNSYINRKENKHTANHNKPNSNFKNDYLALKEMFADDE